jgi:4-hydroxy-tetrahydrodipicolinate synthase
VADEARPLSGVWSATLTPVDAGLRPDAARAIAYYAELLDGGCDGLNVLGTTGEAMSFGVEQRIEFIKAVARELPPERVMAGTGAASLEDTILLPRRHRGRRCGILRAPGRGRARNGRTAAVV